MIQKAMQWRGRNIRGPQDKGVTFFFDSRFRRFLFGGMPKWLQPSYRGDLTLQECIEDALLVLE
jgi:Rad3-related DNA helicase